MNEQIKEYIETIIPNIEKALTDGTGTKEDLVELYKLYKMVLRVTAPHDFITFNKYLEFDEDFTSENKKFYWHRRFALKELFDALNDMEIHDMYDMLLVSSPPRVGKAGRNSTGILTPTGWITHGTVKVGDKVIGSDGKATEVVGVYPQGKLDIYSVKFDDGTFVECTLDHLWTVQSRDDRGSNSNRTITTGEMIKNLYVENETRKNYSINYVKPVEFDGKLESDDLAPYLLGALIGDGSFVDASVKFIPTKYLYSSLEDRVELLKGLMDTDGYGGRYGNSYNEYTTVSKQLADDFIELVRSLGGRATVTSKIGSYKNGGVKIECKTTYRIVFNLENINPFNIERKRNSFTPRKTRCVKYITSIEKVGNDDATCIEISNEDSLYVTDGYNLTHNTTTGIRFLSWIIGRHPENTQLATSYSDSITTSFYIGVMEVILNEKFTEVFPESILINQNAKREEIWLKVAKRYPSISFVPINGSMTGRAEAGNYLYCDDLVSGIEEALSPVRLAKLFQTYSVNAGQRKKNNCKEIHIATRWSVHDPITKLNTINEENDRCKIIKLPCYDEEGESRFDFFGGFDTNYYKKQEQAMDSISFDALYMQNPIEREGILYSPNDLGYYFELPNEAPDTIIAVCDSKNLGKDSVSSPIGYVYGDNIFIEGIVFNNGLPDVTRQLVANAWLEHKVVRGDVEMNNGGNYYAEFLNDLIQDAGGKTSVRMFFSSNNKDVKIITYSDFVKKNFFFKDPSTYPVNSEYAKFMKELFSYTQTGKTPHDDAPDSIAMLAQMYQDLTGNVIKILDRKRLGL